MNIKRFRIQNFRAIEDITLEISSSLTPIIGLNESGKTSILNAIFAFDKTRDRINGGQHLEFDNKYTTTDTKNCTITAVLTLSEQELRELISAAKLDNSSNLFADISGYNERTEILLSRNLDTKEYIFEVDNVDDSDKAASKRIAEFLSSKFPFILYFDDFTDRVPLEIDFPEEYKSKERIRKSKESVWKEIVSEIFRRTMPKSSSVSGDALANYLKLTDRTRRKNILSDIEDELNQEIISEWKRIRQSGSALADDSDKLTLSIANDKDQFMFEVTDQAMGGRRRAFSVRERSKGFQWFFNYMIKLKYNPNYKKQGDNTLFLLDEPGSYLHSSAQIELLKELKAVSDRNMIIYCTHSQYLLNPQHVRLGSIRIARKEAGKIKLENYGNYREAKSTGALSPVHQALNIDFHSDFAGNLVVTEGVTDFYFFKMLQDHGEFFGKNIRFIPGAGAKQLSGLISFSLSFSDNFLVLLDNDAEGKEAKDKYIGEFGETLESRICLYHPDQEKFRLEDFLDESDSKKLKELTGCDDLKRAYGFLYYDYPDKQKDYVTGLSRETKERLELTTELIANLE